MSILYRRPIKAQAGNRTYADINTKEILQNSNVTTSPYHTNAKGIIDAGPYTGMTIPMVREFRNLKNIDAIRTKRLARSNEGAKATSTYANTFANDYVTPTTKAALAFNPVAGPIIGLSDVAQTWKEGERGWALAGAGMEALPFANKYIGKGIGAVINVLADIKLGKYTLHKLGKAAKYSGSKTDGVLDSATNNSFKPASKTKLNSSIDWEKWNKEIPKNKELIKEYNEIERTAKANGTWMKNVDNSKFDGTTEQFVQQRSKNFKKAFKNTKVLNKNGDPLITKHTTFNVFDEFKIKRFGETTDDGFYGKGMYFHPEDGKGLFEYGDIKMNTYLNIEDPLTNPTIMPFFGKSGSGYSKKLGKISDVSTLWKNKYDGVITNHRLEDGTQFPEYVVNIMTNIKSATNNNGMFDMTNPNIYKALFPAAIGAKVLTNDK